MMTLISCIFCQCQIPASASMNKYEEHLQVKVSILVDELTHPCAGVLLITCWDCTSDHTLSFTVERAYCCSDTRTDIQSSVFAQGWHNITETEELKRAVQIASGLQETGSPLHHPCPSGKTLHTLEPTSFPACMDQLSRSPAFSLNSSRSRPNNSPEVKLEPADQYDAGTGCNLVSAPVICPSSLLRPQEQCARGQEWLASAWAS